jgi:hypothetical protein
MVSSMDDKPNFECELIAFRPNNRDYQVPDQMAKFHSRSLFLAITSVDGSDCGYNQDVTDITNSRYGRIKNG